MNLEDIKHYNKKGNDYYYAREFMHFLGYTQWRNFINVIKKSEFVCATYSLNVNDNFFLFERRIKAGATTKRIVDYKLTPIACYFIIQNASLRKREVIRAQQIFNYNFINNHMDINLGLNWDKITQNLVCIV